MSSGLCQQLLEFTVCFCKQTTAYELRISDWSSAVCSSDLRAAATGGDQLTFAAAVAATLAAPAADLCVNLHTRVHGGTAISWEHASHLHMGRDTTPLTYHDTNTAATDLDTTPRKRAVRAHAIAPPPTAEASRAAESAFVQRDGT